MNAGILALGANNAAGTGNISVAAGATFDMSGYTQTGGVFSGAGTLKLQMPNNVGNRLTLTSANFTGTTLVAGLAPQVVTQGETFVPVHTTGGINVTPAVKSPGLIKFVPTLTNANNDLTLTANLVPMASVAANGNQASVGAAYEPLRTAGTTDVNTVVGALNTLDANGVQAALDQMSPVSLGALGGIGMAQSAAQAAAVGQRMLALAQAGGADESTVAHYSTTGRAPFPGELYAEAPGDDGPYESSGSRSRWGFFTSGIFTSGRLQEAPSGAGLQPGYAFNTGGLTAGADYRVNDHLAAGAAAGWLRGHAGLYAPASGTMDDQSARLGVYATTFGEDFSANVYVGGAVDSYKILRGIEFPGISRVAEGRPHGTELNVHPSAIYDVKTAQYGIFSPFAGLDYDRMTIDAFTETGADSLDLSVGGQTAVSAASSLGLKYSQRFHDSGHVYAPYGSLGWRHAFNDQSRPITAAFASGAPFTVMTGKIARDGTLVGLGVSVDWTRDLTAKFDYQGDFRSHYQDSTAALSLRLRF